MGEQNALVLLPGGFREPPTRLPGHTLVQEAWLEEVQQGSPLGKGMQRDPSTPRSFHLHRSTPLVGRSPDGEGRRGDRAWARGPSSGEEGEPLAGRGLGLPRMQEALGTGAETELPARS